MMNQNIFNNLLGFFNSYERTQICMKSAILNETIPNENKYLCK